MSCSYPLFGDLQESIQNINITVPIADYLRHFPIAVEVTKRNLKFKRLKSDAEINFDELEFDEEFKMPREVLLRPELCTIR